MKRVRHWLTGFALAGAALSTAHAQTGVSDDRVSLPEGPGSLEGIGENISINPNMGVMTYGVPIEVPRGFPGVTPDLRLAYSSGGGSGLVGVGWRMSIPYIERSTFKGLPRYTADDRFTADGGTQLVRLPGDAAVYRARYEGGFVRYTWLEVGDGSEGYWQAEYPDGRVATFGATADGTLVPSARVTGPDGTFRYMVVDMVDVHGHRLTHTYQSIDGYALIRQMDYVFTTDDPEYSVSFNYEDRADDTGIDILSDAKAGFDEQLTQRLTAINVFSRENRIRRYELGYERYVDSGGFTRLASVSRLGLDGSVHPAVQQFGWSRGLDGEGLGEQSPFVIDMGNIGVNIGVGRATFIDINGDALPDLIDTSDDGAHQFLLNIPAEDGRSRFSNQPVSSGVGEGSGFRLGTPFVQVLDVNGDGFADLLDARNGRALINRGGGDWDRLENLGGTGEVSDALGAGFDAEDGSLSTLRFLDIDNDKRIDLVRSGREDTRIWRNAGAGGFEVLDDVDVLGYDMAVDGIQMSDMNGDGLLDAVKLNVGGLRYRLNLGHGRWGDEVEVLGLPIDESELDLASLDDLNGDGLSDLVVVVGRQVKFAINRNGTVFSQITTLGSGDVEGELPLRDGTTSVLMADVNGNGSTDVVWLDAQGQVTALEMFPVRPNQLNRVANSLGMVSQITYSTSVQEMARDGDWAFTLPHPMQVVAQVQRSDSATGVTQATTYRYRDGFYDGEEKQFRGFAQVSMQTLGDASQAVGRVTNVYDVGAEDRYRHGRMLSMQVESGDRLLSRTTKTFDDCPLADVPQTEPAVRFICGTGTEIVQMEGAAAAEHVTVRTQMRYDGYGNVIEDINHGIVAVGGGDCAPCADDVGGACGADCTGDERVKETEFIAPGDATDGRWLLRLPIRYRASGGTGTVSAESEMFYDGPAFEGLPSGQATLGMLTRVTQQVSDTDRISSLRVTRDDHGNTIERLDPLAAVDGTTHRTRFEYDADGLRVIRTERPLERPDGTLYSLVRTTTYEDVFDSVSSTSDWRVFDADGTALTPDNRFNLTYDTFNRVASIARPGDRPDAPGEVFEYLLDAPVSRVISRRRSTIGGPLDLEAVTCLDGRGRSLQTRTLKGDGAYHVSGLVVYNVAGQPVREYQAFESGSAECDIETPADVRFIESRRDGLGRVVESIQPDADLHGSPSITRTVYGPTTVTSFDAEDADPDSPHADTPAVAERDGLGRLIAAQRVLADGTTATTRNVYDGLGRVVAVVDAQGNVKRQTYDLLGRVLRIEDPNKDGVVQMTYDAASNLIAYDDGRGTAVNYVFDGANRTIERFVAGQRDTTLETTIWDFDAACDPAVCTNPADQMVTRITPGLDDTPNRIQMGYDARGRVIRIDRQVEGVLLSTRSSYDAANRLIETTYPNGQTISNRYDALSRLVAIDGIVDAIEYDARGDLVGMTYANGARTEWTYDALRQLDGRSVTVDGAPLLDLGLSRDRVGNLLTVEDNAGRLPRGMTFDYDAWYRTIRTADTDGRAIDHTFDVLDNVVRRDGEGDLRTVLGDYTTAVNTLQQAGDLRLEHDAAGHVSAHAERTLDWDPMGRLRSVTGDALDMQIAYDASHRRTAHRVGDSLTLYGGPTFELHDGISALYVTLGNTRLARIEDDALATTVLSDLAVEGFEPDGRITAGDAWTALGAQNDALTLAGDEAPSAAGALLNSAVHRMFAEQTDVAWLHHDHMGSIVMATDADRQVLGERAFEATGAERSDAEGDVDAFGFTGQAVDPTGWIHFEHRLLDPQTGHWLSADPKFAISTAAHALNPAESLNVYGYVRNNYANYIDPKGLNGNSIKGGPKGGTPSTGSSRNSIDPALRQRINIPRGVLQRGQRAFHRQLGRARRGALRQPTSFTGRPPVRLRLGRRLFDNGFGTPPAFGTRLRGLRPNNLRAAANRSQARFRELTTGSRAAGPFAARPTAGGGLLYSVPMRGGVSLAGTLSAPEVRVARVMSGAPVRSGSQANVRRAITNVQRYHALRPVMAEITARVPLTPATTIARGTR